MSEYDPSNPPEAPDITPEEFKKLKRESSIFHKIRDYFRDKTDYENYLAGKIDEKTFVVRRFLNIDKNEKYTHEFELALDIAESAANEGNPIKVGEDPNNPMTVTITHETIDDIRKRLGIKTKNK